MVHQSGLDNFTVNKSFVQLGRLHTPRKPGAPGVPAGCWRSGWKPPKDQRSEAWSFSLRFSQKHVVRRFCACFSCHVQKGRIRMTWRGRRWMTHTWARTWAYIGNVCHAVIITALCLILKYVPTWRVRRATGHPLSLEDIGFSLKANSSQMNDWTGRPWSNKNSRWPPQSPWSYITKPIILSQCLPLVCACSCGFIARSIMLFNAKCQVLKIVCNVS